MPVARAIGLVSCMRLRQRTKVDLPQPEGPMSAVAWFAGMWQVDVLQGVIGPVPRVQILH